MQFASIRPSIELQSAVMMTRTASISIKARWLRRRRCVGPWPSLAWDWLRCRALWSACSLAQDIAGSADSGRVICPNFNV